MVKTVRNIKKIDTEKVYDITVEDSHHYILENGLVTHNSGLKYSASTIVYLSKKKDKDGTDVIGNIVHCKLHKSRLTKENKVVDVNISYDSGLNPYYGLLPLAEKHGLIKKVSTKFEFPDGTKAFEKSIYKNPEKYFTPEFMDALEPLVAKEFKYGMGVEVEEASEE